MLDNASSPPSETADDREARVQALLGQLRPGAERALRQMAERLADLTDDGCFGQVAYDLRDLAHQLAADSHQAGLQAAKKRLRRLQRRLPALPGRRPLRQDRDKTWVSLNGLVSHGRAYYHCDACGTGHCPFDTANELEPDHLSAGLRPLVCLAGALASFRQGAEDVLRRFAAVRLSASTTRRATRKAGEGLAQQQQAGDIAVPAPLKPWDFRLAEGYLGTVAYLGLDAFCVPRQQPGGGKEEGRMLYAAVLYTPDKQDSHYLVDFDLRRLAGQMRQAAIALGLGRAGKVIALTDAGNGIEAALRDNFWDDLLCILDWYHAAEHLHAFARCLHPRDDAARAAWAGQAKGTLYEQGGTALLAWLRGLAAPADATAADELRKLVGYFADNEHRTDYPSYRAQGWDIGSGPTEAACKVVGARLKHSGMRWLEEGAAEVAPLRALYLSGPDAWDAFWGMTMAV